MSLSNFLVIRVDDATQNKIERIALEAGVTRSALVRHSLKLVSEPRPQSLVYDVIMRIKKPEFTKEKYMVKANGSRLRIPC